MKALLATIVASLALAAPASAATVPYITDASGAPVSASASAITVNIGSAQAVNAEYDYRVCGISVGGQTFSLPAGATIWTGGDTIAPGQNVTAQLYLSTDPGCAGPQSQSNAVTFAIATYVPPLVVTVPPSTTTTTTTTPAGQQPQQNQPSGTDTTPATTTPATASVLPAPPSADFTGSGTSKPGEVSLSSTATAGDSTIVSQIWNFGDGASGIGANVKHSYLGFGSYVVTLTVVDSAGLTSQAAREITVGTAGQATTLSARIPAFRVAAVRKAAAKATAAAAARARARAKAKALAAKRRRHRHG